MCLFLCHSTLFLSFYIYFLLYHPPTKHTVAITQGGAIQLASNGTDGVQGLQTLTMTNAAAAAQPGATILQYAQTSDGQQILVPSNQVVVQGELGNPGSLFILYQSGLAAKKVGFKTLPTLPSSYLR